MPHIASPGRANPVPSSAPEPSFRARQDFFNLMSHEIRTPLNGVLGMLSLLARTGLTPEQTAYLDTARQSGAHLLGLVNNLLDYARMDAGHFELEDSLVPLEPLLQGVAELLSPRAYENGIDIAWGLDPRLSHLHGDEGRLRQILFNLAGNAVKFTHSGGVLIRIDLTSDARVRFIVADTGPGIPQSAQARIFEPFAQVDNRHATQYGGSGLGLMVVAKLVEAMKAEISLFSAPGEGTRFEVVFPAAYRLSPECLSRPRTDVTLISDNPYLAEGARLHGQAEGFNVKWSQGGEQLASAEGLVMADRKCLPSTPVAPPHDRCLILLAPEERDEIETWRALGWAGYLIKPLRRASVAARLKALTEVIAPAAPSLLAEDERIQPRPSLTARVLLVEDNPVNALLAQILLQREGCEVERAASGEEALEILTHNQFDVVFMDLGLPGLDGVGATRILRARGDATPVIALTANAYEEDRRACFQAGMDDFLTKPIEPETLRQKLCDWVNQDLAAQEAATGLGPLT